MTRSHVIVPAERRARIKTVYEMADVLDPDWPENSDRTFLVMILAQNTGQRRDDIHKWLADPDRYSPFPDPVALKRAWEWDPSAINNLTDLEWTLWITRLAQDPDPYEERASTPPVFSDSRYGYHPGEFEALMTPRYSAWSRLPKQMKDRITQAIVRRRKSLAAEEK
jgi:hypothetical protein